MTDPPLSICQLLLLYTCSPFVPSALNQTHPIDKLHKGSDTKHDLDVVIAFIQVIYSRVTWPCVFRQMCGLTDNTSATGRWENNVDNGVCRSLSPARAIKPLQRGLGQRRWRWRRARGEIKHSTTLFYLVSFTIVRYNNVTFLWHKYTLSVCPSVC